MRRFENIIIATDLDGTFLGGGSRLIERNLESIEYFKAHGGRFTVATGRTPYNAADALPGIAELINMPAVTINGCCLYDFKTESIIAGYTMPSEDVIEIGEYVKEYDKSFAIRAATLRGFVTDDRDNPYLKNDFNAKGRAEKRVLPLSEWRGETFYKLVVRGSEDALAEFRPILTEKLLGRFAVTKSWSTMLEIHDLSRSKAVALDEIADRVNDPDVKLCTAGDYDNDIEMLTASDVSVCPSNAVDKVKEISKYCLCSNEEGVIADLIEGIDRGDILL